MTRPRIAFVVAVARNGVIGRKGVLPWRISSDLKRFKQITMGKPVIMGRKTWESLPKRPLTGRLNIVITRHRDYSAAGAFVVASVDAALAEARRAQPEEICVIGGSEIFGAFLPMADRLYLTEVELEPEGDAIFPPLDFAQWQETSRETHVRAEGDDAGFVLRVLDRKR
ncbi:dihydrofolate reductase [Nordella sp. HKS 07]|uniref:dihydrofolate reductase n=1 Tax=Nordella sp. HKS 07 TaxID=2712222 RepID=UPI0013E1A81E|nr:dihydrofolate reductase [Nordella sp. HKS 07]QIG51890.1 dihydrofolate reductase [Nordella sp. HKS 07]